MLLNDIDTKRGLQMSRYDLEPEVLDAIAEAGYDVYQPEGPRKTYLYYTDGTNIGYLQRGNWGGLALSTVHIPNTTTGTGYAITGGSDPAVKLTKEDLATAFAGSPSWASSRDRESVRKYANMEAFLKSQSIVPLELVRKGVR